LTLVPVIVVGADTEPGRAIVAGLLAPGREVRAFVSDIGAAGALRRSGVKVALGDVSDESHVEGASMHCHTAVLVMEASTDERERSFAASGRDVLRGWARAVLASEVTRVIWVGDGEVAQTGTMETARVSATHPALVAEVVALDNAISLP